MAIPFNHWSRDHRAKEAERIKTFARCVSRPNESGADATDCAAIGELFKYLDLLDRKSSSLITFNSFLTPLSTFFVFTPLGLFGQSKVAAGDFPVLIAGTAALSTSFLTIFTALRIISIRWNYLEKAEMGDPCNLAPEVEALSMEAARRQSLFHWIWTGTFIAFILNFAAILLTVYGAVR